MEIGITLFGTFVSFPEKNARVSFPIIQATKQEDQTTG